MIIFHYIIVAKKGLIAGMSDLNHQKQACKSNMQFRVRKPELYRNELCLLGCPAGQI